MSIIYTKEVNDYKIVINDRFTADPKETYANEDRTAYAIEGDGVSMVTFETIQYEYYTNPAFHRDGGNTINNQGPWWRCLYFVMQNGALVLKIAGNDSYNGLLSQYLTDYIPQTANWSPGSGGHNRQCTFSTNLPIFDNYTDAEEYINETNADRRAALIQNKAVNYVSNDFDEETKLYYINNQYGEAECIRNSATATGSLTWRSMRFMANKKPVLYYNDNDYSLTLVAGGVVSSYSLGGPVYIIDNVPQSAWADGELMYTGLWYGTILSRMTATGEVLPDGQYMYGFEFSTNIYIFKDQATAEAAIENDDYSEAVNYPEISGGGSYNPPDFGIEEEETVFGGGADTSPFMQTYVLSRNALMQVADAWYNTDPQTLESILTGLKMFGSIPHDALAGITMYPFDVNRILNTTEQRYIYFGAHQLNLGGTILYKAVSLASSAYLDCGTIFLAALFHSFRDYEPYTTIDVYLPYIGWQRMDSRLLINKTINVRYYVDIHTRSCTACILANGVLISQHSGTIGIGLPVCGTDYQSYANAMGSTILGGATDIATGAKGAISGALGLVGSAGAGIAIATSLIGIGSVAANTAATLNKMEAYGTPADHPIIKGGFTSGIGTYMPQYVIWRYTVHETVEPSSFNDMNGRPSSASGNIGSFSGYLSCKQVKLNTSGMLDAEAAEVYNLLKNGVYL